MNEVKRTECGWGGHFCCAYRCLFRRNTHLEYKGIKAVVSTVGNMFKDFESMKSTEFETVGYDRRYETMAFYSDPDSAYDDINPSEEISLSDWYITPEEADKSETSDLLANDMHERCVDEVIEMLKKGEL